MLPDRLLPPKPSGAMDGAVGEGVQVVDVAPVAYEDEFHGAALIFALPAGLSEDWGCGVVISFATSSHSDGEILFLAVV